jgi:hypothetical protein
MSHTIRRTLIHDNNQKARAFFYELIDGQQNVLCSVLGKNEATVTDMFCGLMRMELQPLELTPMQKLSLFRKFAEQILLNIP